MTTEDKTTDLTYLDETLKQEVQKVERKYDKLLLEFKMKSEQYLEKEAEIGTLNLQLENLKVIENEKASLEGGMAVYEEELLKARNELKAKEVEIVTLLEVLIISFVSCHFMLHHLQPIQFFRFDKIQQFGFLAKCII